MKKVIVMRSRGKISCILTLLFAQSALFPKQPLVICGTERGLAKEEAFLHSQSMKARRKLGARAATGPVGKDIGNIAVMYDSDGIVAKRNPFNLSSKSITFTPNAEFRGYRSSLTDSTYDEAAANDGTMLAGLQDDDTRSIRIPFSFLFYGKEYSQLWVNSDGNVSFEEGDSDPATKSIGLLAGGPPRIAVLFTDLDPSKSSRGVRVFKDSSRVVISWVGVPEFGAGRPPLTFQVRLYDDGHIETAYPLSTISETIIGLSPGRSIGETDLVSYSGGDSAEHAATFAERFTSADSIDTVLLSQRFFQTHDDAYDYLVLYNTIGIAARSFAVSTELSVRSTNRAGFGDIPVDIGAQYGSRNRMQAFLNMGPLTNYPRDPNGPVALRGSTGDTPLTILAHEAGHLFLALASIRDPADPSARPMLGAALAHWSFNFNSDASFLEGNRIEDQGENSSPRYRTTATVQHYSVLDQYLMGFVPPSDVPPLFLVKRTNHFNDEPPRVGISFNGDRQNFTVDDVISGEGRRAPDSTLAQRRFRMGVILLVRAGTEPAQEDLDQLETIRSQFEPFFAASTDNRALMETSLKKNLQLSLGTASGVLLGSTVNASLTLDRPAEADLNVVFSQESGNVELPDSVTIPAGSTEVIFCATGKAVGVDVITATADDGSYITDIARVQVNESAENLTLEIVSGDQQDVTPGFPLSETIRVRATDINLIAYPGLTIQAETDSGTVDGVEAQTGADGVAKFQWTPDNNEKNVLRFTLAGSSVNVSVTANGQVSVSSLELESVGSQSRASKK